MKLIKLLSEAKFAVEVEDIGTVIVDGSSEAEVKSRLSKKLKACKESIKSVRKITKDKAGKASKALGEELPLYSDYAKQHKEADADASGMGEPDGQQRGKAKRCQRWLQPNPKNQY